jgi:hypothetical protein
MEDAMDYSFEFFPHFSSRSLKTCKPQFSDSLAAKSLDVNWIQLL